MLVVIDYQHSEHTSMQLSAGWNFPFCIIERDCTAPPLPHYFGTKLGRGCILGVERERERETERASGVYIFEDYFLRIRARNEWIMNKNNQGRKFSAPQKRSSSSRSFSESLRRPDSLAREYTRMQRRSQLVLMLIYHRARTRRLRKIAEEKSERCIIELNLQACYR
jgi:hypothetical protein